MPLYDYRCETCNIEIERMVKVSEAREQKCSECKSDLRKIIKAPDHPTTPHISWSKWRAGLG